MLKKKFKTYLDVVHVTLGGLGPLVWTKARGQLRVIVLMASMV